MLITTKIQIPRVRQSLVARPGLLSKLNEGMNAKLTLVSAPAGYGKSTLLSEWAKHCGVPVAWVSLDKQDNEWAPFWSCMVAAVRERIPSFGQSVTDLLTHESDTSQETIMRAMLHELILVPGEMVIVLDDYHLIELSLIHESLGYLLEYLPPHIHLYIASRSELAIPTARLLAKGELHPIDRNDLKFDLAEGMVFFRELMNLTLTKEQELELFRQTEGWVSGLQLAAIMLKRSDNIAESIRQFSGRQRHISDYLLEEVYVHLSSSLRDFLLATSVLGRMNQELCEAITERMDSQNQLEKLEKMNLFIIPLDEERHWFRYHHLLSEFLQQVGARENPSLWRQSHIRAATWYENEGSHEEAIEHYIKGEQAEDAVRLIDRHYPELVYAKGNVLLRWLSSLPKSSYEDKPMFELFNISKLLMNGEWQQAMRRAEQAENIIEALRDSLPEPEWKQRMGDLYFFRGTLASLQHDLSRASHDFELLDFYSPEGSMFQHFGNKRYDGHDQFMSLLSLVDDLHGAEKFLLRWIKAWENKPNYPFVGYKYVSYCMLMYEWNRLEETEHYLGQAMSREDLRSNVKIWMDLGLVFSWLQQAQGRGSQAIEWLTHLGFTIDSPDRHLIMQRIEAVQARLLLSQGQDERVFEWLERCGLSHEDEVSMRCLEEYSILVRLLAARGRTAESLQLLEKLEALVNKTNRLRDRIKLLILRSMVLRQSNCPEAAMSPLRMALRLSEPAGYIRSFLDEGPPMLEMLTELLREQQDAAIPGVSREYISRLLEAAGDSREDESQQSVALTEQEARVLLLFAEGLFYKEIMFVALGLGNNSTILLTSSDGAEWTKRTSGTTNYLSQVTNGYGTYVAVGTSGTILTSNDGVNWTSQTSGTTETLIGATYANGKFVAVGYNGKILISSNGVNWTSQTSGTTEILIGVNYGNGKFVAVGDGGTILTSGDGKNWTSRTSDTKERLFDITYGNGKYVAVGSIGTILTSNDGESWTSNVSGSQYMLTGVTYSNGMFMVVGGRGTILTSNDGANWTSRTSGTALDLREVIYGNGT